MVSQYFPPEVGATQSRMQSFAEYLAERGHRRDGGLRVPEPPAGESSPSVPRTTGRGRRSNPYRVLRVWVQASHEKTQRTRLAFYLSYMGMATAVTPLTGRADVVVATTPPLFAGAAGYAISLLTRAPLVLDVRDLWPAAAVSLGQISTGRPCGAPSWPSDCSTARPPPSCGDAPVLRRTSTRPGPRPGDGVHPERDSGHVLLARTAAYASSSGSTTAGSSSPSPACTASHRRCRRVSRRPRWSRTSPRSSSSATGR